MLDYNNNLRDAARDLRKNQTVAETVLWAKLRRKQMGGVQFYRQKPIAGFIVDFYCAAANLVIELDGKHHAEGNQVAYDQGRTAQLEAHGLHVIRFSNQQVFQNLEAVLTQIHATLLARIQFPPLQKEEAKTPKKILPPAPPSRLNAALCPFAKKGSKRGYRIDFNVCVLTSPFAKGGLRGIFFTSNCGKGFLTLEYSVGKRARRAPIPPLLMGM